LQAEIEELFEEKPQQYTQEHQNLFAAFKSALNAGEVRAAEPAASAPSGWRVNGWVKKGILIGFRMGEIVDMSIDPLRQPFLDKDTYPVRVLTVSSGVRIVPGGSSIRDGCYIGRGVTCMPPMYINTGAYVGEGTMVDSHALVGSCAQIGKNCHISAASQIGGVLGTGTILNRSTPVYDLVRGEVRRASDDQPLVVPEGAVVVAGSRAVTGGPGKDWGISVYTPVIVKYRDEKTDTRIQLEDLLR
jgi:2,3,4,5-tetrahydropyridine-2-carboxylate N-succinyltransferase